MQPGLWITPVYLISMFAIVQILIVLGISRLTVPGPLKPQKYFKFHLYKYLV